MASSPQGARLTESHRQAQVANQQTFLSEFLAMWALLNAAELDATGPGWVRAVMSLIRAFRQRSADLAVDYYRQYRLVEVPEVSEPAPIPVFETPASEESGDRQIRMGNRSYTAEERSRLAPIVWRNNDRAARTSLIVTGPVNIKARTGRAEPLESARQHALVESSGAASRHVLNGGRKTLLTVVDSDAVALGWARVTDGDPCAFCALLASRGPAYKTRQQAAFQPHDHCACTPEPVFSREAAWPGRAREFRELYDAVTRNTVGKGSIRAFRRAYEQEQRDARRAEVA